MAGEKRVRRLRLLELRQVDVARTGLDPAENGVLGLDALSDTDGGVNMPVSKAVTNTTDPFERNGLDDARLDRITGGPSRAAMSRPWWKEDEPSPWLRPTWWRLGDVVRGSRRSREQGVLVEGLHGPRLRRGWWKEASRPASDAAIAAELRETEMR